MAEQDFGGARPKVRTQRPRPLSDPQPSTSAPPPPDFNELFEPAGWEPEEHSTYSSPLRMLQERPASWMGSPMEPIRIRQRYRGSPERRERAHTYHGQTNDPAIVPNLRRCNMCQKLFTVSETTPSSVCTRCIPTPKPGQRDKGKLRRMFRSAHNLFSSLPIVRTVDERRRTVIPSLFDVHSLDEAERGGRDYWRLQSVSRLHEATDHLNTLEEWELHIPIERALHPTHQNDRPKSRLKGYAGCGVSSEERYTSATAPCELHRLGHPECWLSQEFKEIPPESYQSFWTKYMEARPKSFVIRDRSGKTRTRKDAMMKTQNIYYPRCRRDDGDNMAAIEEDEFTE